MCFTVRVPNSTRFISRLKNLFPNDLDRIQALYPEHGRHEHLSTDERGRCVFLGPAGCLFPAKALPVYSEYLDAFFLPFNEPQCISEFGRHRIADVRIFHEEFFSFVSALAYPLSVI